MLKKGSITAMANLNENELYYNANYNASYNDDRLLIRFLEKSLEDLIFTGGIQQFPIDRLFVSKHAGWPIFFNKVIFVLPKGIWICFAFFLLKKTATTTKNLKLNFFRNLLVTVNFDLIILKNEKALLLYRFREKTNMASHFSNHLNKSARKG